MQPFTRCFVGPTAVLFVALLSGCSAPSGLEQLSAGDVPATTVATEDVPGTTGPAEDAPASTPPTEDAPPDTVPAGGDSASGASVFVDNGGAAEALDIINPGAQDQSEWRTFAADAIDVNEAEVPNVDGLEVFNPGLLLADGRYLVRGIWHEDPVFPGWNQRNPDSVSPDEDQPERRDNPRRPIRLFVVDADIGSVVALSHMPEVRPFQTAVSVGEGPDVVLDVVVLPGERVAYSVGFNGAAYDVPYGAFVAALPAAR